MTNRVIYYVSICMITFDRFSIINETNVIWKKKSRIEVVLERLLFSNIFHVKAESYAHIQNKFNNVVETVGLCY